MVNRNPMVAVSRNPISLVNGIPIGGRLLMLFGAIFLLNLLIELVKLLF